MKVYDYDNIIDMENGPETGSDLTQVVPDRIEEGTVLAWHSHTVLPL